MALNLANNAAGVIINAFGVGLLLTNMRCLESPAPDIMSRVSVHEPFATDITSIIPVPVGNGNVMCDSKVIVQANLADRRCLLSS